MYCVQHVWRSTEAASWPLHMLHRPAHWRSFEVTRRFRGRTLRIRVENPDGVEKGVREIKLNGRRMAGNLIPTADMREVNEAEALVAEVLMGSG